MLPKRTGKWMIIFINVKLFWYKGKMCYKREHEQKVAVISFVSH